MCDSDPLKLHYSWCLSRIGAAPPERFERELAQVRRAFAAGTLGLADLVLVSVPALETLQRQRNADRSRRRRHFDLHCQLGEHLRTWYAGVDALDPGRVIWQLPAEGVPALEPFAHGSLSEALMDMEDMSEEKSSLNEQAAASTSPRAMNDIASLVILFNVVTAGLGGLYTTTQSIGVTAVAAGLVALLGLCVVVGRTHRH